MAVYHFCYLPVNSDHYTLAEKKKIWPQSIIVPAVYSCIAALVSTSHNILDDMISAGYNTIFEHIYNITLLSFQYPNCQYRVLAILTTEVPQSNNIVLHSGKIFTHKRPHTSTAMLTHKIEDSNISS